MNPIQHSRRMIAPLLVFSLLSNLAVLISPLFMMQVLDRVVPSGNTATLVLLGALALSALLVQGVAEGLRDLSLRRLGTWIEGTGSGQLMQDCGASPAETDMAEHCAAVAGLTQALRGPTAQAALSLPWLPLFILALALIHAGFVALLFGLLCALFLLDRILTITTVTTQMQLAQDQQREQTLFQNAGKQGQRLGNAMATQHMLARAFSLQVRRHQHSDRLDLPQAFGGSIAGVLRSAGQVMALGLGAYLVTQNQLSAGGMIAASLIVSRSYGSCETVLKQGPALRQALEHYRVLLRRPQMHAPSMALPAFKGALTAENLTCPRGGGAAPYLDRVSFSLAPGECLAIVGAAGSGKTSLLQALSGLKPAAIGSTFYDDSAQRSLPPEASYRLIGSLPQRADLIAGSLADNIACFDPDRDDDAVVAAAQAAGVHGLIAALPEGYESDLSRCPHVLSAGQVQRVALARALYTQPRYLFLDEPNALLDGDGERALLQTLLRLKASGTTIVMVLHRSGVMGVADKILRLDQGRVVDFGPRAEVLARLSGNQRQIRLPALATSQHDLRDWVASQFTRASDEAFSQKAQIIAQEMFQLALAAAGEQANPPPELAFSLKFRDEFECDLRMVGDVALDLSEKIIRVRKELRHGREMGQGSSRDEQALAALERMGSALCQQTLEGRTTLQASVLAHNAPRSSGGREQGQRQEVLQ